MDIRNIDIEKVAKAVELDAGQALSGLRESLTQAKRDAFATSSHAGNDRRIEGQGPPGGQRQERCQASRHHALQPGRAGSLQSHRCRLANAHERCFARLAAHAFTGLSSAHLLILVMCATRSRRW